ncbi:MAG: hypothetical protein IPJ75_16645 [Ignavibacteriales bacterium]|nr:hypothetical protein [Ignavibacteriales bacterium]
MKNFITFFLVLNSLLLSQWTQIDMMPFEGRIIGFYMTASMNITAAFDGDSCSIIKSSDGGRNWVISRQIPLAYLAWVEFLDEDHIFVGGQFPIICKRTSNGGATWSNVSIPSIYYQIRKLQFFDYNNGYALVEFSGGSSYLGRLLKTTDGGMSWVDIDMVRPNLSGFRFINKNTGWLFGDSLYRTTDGGSTFTLVPLPFNFKNPRSLDVIHDSIIVMGGLKYVESSPHIILTKPITAFSFNRGSTWRVKDFGTDDVWGDADNIRLLDENTAITTLSGSYNYAGGYTGVIYTTNQGLTWSKGAGEVTNYNFSDMKFLNNKVYVGGSEASFLASGNRLSDPWELRFEQEYQGPQGAAFLNPGYAVIGTASRSSKPSKVYISNDKGNSWIVKYAPWHYLYDMAISPDSVLYSLQ